jgi:hypothetical protein
MTFLLANWRIILIACLVAIAGYYKISYESVTRDLEAYKTTQEVLFQAAIKRNSDLKLQSDKLMADLISEHKKELEAENLNRARETKKLKGSINEISNALTIAYDAIELRNESSSNNPMPQILKDTSGLAEAFGTCNRTLITVTEACKVTTIDYGALYNAWDKQCIIHACE